MWIYHLVVAVTRPFLNLVFRVKYEGRENTPQEGALIVASNHKALYDPFLLAYAVNREIHFLAKKELFELPIVGSILRKAEMIPLTRGSNDIKAIKTCLRTLKEEKVLGIFPEGTRVKDDQQLAAKAGLGMFAAKGNAAILPVTIEGDYKPFRKTIVRIHQPIRLEDRKYRSEEYPAIGNSVMQVIRDEES